MDPTEVTPGVVALVRDLLFASRISAEARAAGVTVKIVRDAPALANTPARRLFVDLNQPGALEAARIWSESTGRPVTGFVSHVDHETIAAARAAGIDEVLARSGFVEQLSRLLKESA